jgi:hypothetical protein
VKNTLKNNRNHTLKKNNYSKENSLDASPFSMNSIIMQKSKEKMIFIETNFTNMDIFQSCV